MNGRFMVLLGLIIGASVAGCAGDMEAVKKTGQESSRDIDKNRSEPEPVSQEYADVSVSASLKTHKPGIYVLDDKCHGTDSFKIMVRIDAAPLQMTSSLREEDSSYVGEEDPESGKGIRYEFVGSLRFKAGKHTIAVSIPKDRIFVQRDIHLKEGANRIMIEPVYNRRKPYRKIGFVGDTSFYEGIKGFRVVVNGEGR